MVQLNIEEKSYLWFEDEGHEDTKVVLITMKGVEDDYGPSTLDSRRASQSEKV